MPLLHKSLSLILSLLGLVILLFAFWQFWPMFWTANALVYHQYITFPGTVAILLILFPVTAIIFPLYWLMAFGDILPLIELLSLILGWLILALGLDMTTAPSIRQLFLRSQKD